MNEREYFKSKGPSSFIDNTRNKLDELNIIKAANSNWKISGATGFRAKYLPIIESIENRYGKGLVTQIWMQRPLNGYTRCVFEVAYEISLIGNERSIKLREKIASSIRLFLTNNNLPIDIEEAHGSTVVAIRINLPRIQVVEDDTDKNVDDKEINKIIQFLVLLDEKLNTWNKTNAINSIEI